MDFWAMTGVTKLFPKEGDFLLPYLFPFSLSLTLYFFSSLLSKSSFSLTHIKNSLDDPSLFLSSWNDQDDTPCSWAGIKCDSPTNVVSSVDLSSLNLFGPFPSLLCRLPSLTFISLYNNSINSTLPSYLSTCQNLVGVDLSQNLLTGTLPSTLPDLLLPSAWPTPSSLTNSAT